MGRKVISARNESNPRPPRPAKSSNRGSRGWIIGGGIVASLLGVAVVMWGRGGNKNQPQDRDQPWNLLVITLDTTRADGLGCYGNSDAMTPNLDRLASEGVRFARAYTCAPLTLPSHASLFTGVYPSAHGIHYNGTHSLAESVETLAERLSQHGFVCGASLGAYVLHGQFGLKQGFHEYYDRFSADEGGVAERSAEWVTRDGLHFLKNHADDRFFLWLHYYDPHEPYAPPSPFREKFAGREYQGEIAYTDAQIGQVLETLTSSGAGLRTLIVVVADHGESLIHREGRQGHGLFLYEETMRIPLILHMPDVLAAGKVVDSTVSIVDVMPTVLRLLRLPADSTCHGRDLVELMEGTQGTPSPHYLETFGPREVFGWSELRGLILDPWKYIDAPTPELYDLSVDPLEKNNLTASEPERVLTLTSELAALIERTSVTEQAISAGLSELDRNRLAALGYVAADETTPLVSEPLPDPKDMIDVAAAHGRAQRLMETNPGAAVQAFRAILDDHPDDSSAHASLGRLMMNLGQWDEAVKHFRKVLTVRPDAVLTLRLLGFTLFQAGKHDEALQALERSLAINARSNQSLFLKSLVLEAKNDIQGATQAVYDSLSIDGAYDPARLHYGRLLAKDGRHKDAVKVLSSIPPTSTARYAAREEIARIHETLGEASEAKQVQTELAQLRSRNAPRTPAIVIAGGGY